MFFAALMLSASLLGHLPKLPHSITLPFTTPVQTAGDWRLKVRADRFNGEVSCEVKSDFAQVRRHTVIFQLGRATNTSDADVRINDGPALKVRDIRMDNLRDGFSGRAGPIENPTRGEVGLPITLVAGADHVLVRPQRGKKPYRRFEIAGLTEILAKA
ncbi:MAG: hypothetical protein JWP92_132, partial [Caulobacter sp.]|nr:hypothetical protein [Caulobacter sp.]